MDADEFAATRFEILEHTADVGFAAEAPGPERLFEAAAQAFIEIAIEREAIAQSDALQIEVAGDDLPSLLVNFLEEMLYLFDTARFAPAAARVETVSPTRLRANLLGEARDPARHRWKLIVKAVTYHGLEVQERDGRWSARVFLDV
jgi:SHS2 domain-containing protein